METLKSLTPIQAKTWLGSVHIVAKDSTTGIFDPIKMFNTMWSTWYAGDFYFNFSPWVEHGYCQPFGGLSLAKPNDPIPNGAWLLELLMTSDQPGALGYHQDQPRTSMMGPSGAHSMRGTAIHPETGLEIPLMKVFCDTAIKDGVYITEVLTHELFEALVDPQVEDEALIRKYANPADGFTYISEVGDPVQDEPFLVGEYMGGILPVKPAVPEAMISNMAWPKWFDLPQSRSQFDQRGSCKNPFEVRPGGYMSRFPTNSPGSWENIFGSDKAKARHPNPQ